MASIVLVASDIGLRDAWRVELETGGHKVRVASTAIAAMAQLQSGRVEIVVVDYEVMGGIIDLMTGLQRMRDAPPFVLVAGAVDAPPVSAHFGAAAFLPKPIHPSELAGVVSRVAA